MAGIHPTIISESFQKALEKGLEILTDMSRPVQLSDRETLLNSATTSLNSKVRLPLRRIKLQLTVCYDVVSINC
jgi:chaperonin GroEL (HSP60 family)